MEIGILGATGLVGMTLVEELLQQGFSQLRLYRSAENTNESVTIQRKTLPLVTFAPEQLEGVQVLFFATPAAVSRAQIPRLPSSIDCIIDGSEAFRMDPAVPLIIPEINEALLTKETRCIASPNCTATIALMGLAPLHRAFSLKTFSLCSYQAASGMGHTGIEELEQQCRQWAQQQPLTPAKVFPKTLLFNAIPQVGSLLPNGWTSEEEKLAAECRNILALPHLQVCATCVRIPALCCHSMAISATFQRPFSLAEVRQVWDQASGIQYYDEDYPDVYAVQEDTHVHLGRLRIDPTRENTLIFWAVGNQLRKGAATNMRQIFQRWLALQKQA